MVQDVHVKGNGARCTGEVKSGIGMVKAVFKNKKKFSLKKEFKFKK